MLKNTWRHIFRETVDSLPKFPNVYHKKITKLKSKWFEYIIKSINYHRATMRCLRFVRSQNKLQSHPQFLLNKINTF